ncbi:30S ribosomal protein S9 [Patescibacteria group bacterium]
MATKKTTTKKDTVAKKAPVKKAAPKKTAAKTKEPKEVKMTKKEKKEKKIPATGRYYYAVGRRKSAVAQTRLTPGGKGEITVNGRELSVYFPVLEYQGFVLAPLKAVGQDDKVTVTLKITGGGLRGQADAARLGITRALLVLDPDYRATLKPLGFITRDPRVKERKKPGLKGARRAPQWSKR